MLFEWFVSGWWNESSKLGLCLSLKVTYCFFFLTWGNAWNLGSCLCLRIGYLTSMNILLEFSAEVMKIEANSIIVYFNYELFYICFFFSIFEYSLFYKSGSSLYQTVLFAVWLFSAFRWGSIVHSRLQNFGRRPFSCRLQCSWISSFGQ